MIDGCICREAASGRISRLRQDEIAKTVIHKIRDKEVCEDTHKTIDNKVIG